jgi:hypothetical protein
MNKVSERYNTKVEIPITVLLETIFSDDNQDVESLSRWAYKYGFIDLIKDDTTKYGYYKLQDDYNKQDFYIWLDKEERKQYDYENKLLDRINKAIEYIERYMPNYDFDKTNLTKVLDILKGVDKE